MSSSQGRIEFDRITVDLETRHLTSNGRQVVLQEKPLRLLVTLLGRRGRVVGRDELYDALWPSDIFVDREAGLNTAVRKLRAALREVSGESRELVATVPRVGYRLEAEPPRRGSRRRAVWSALAAGGLLLVLALAWGAGDGALPSGEPMPEPGKLRTLYVEARSLLGTMDGDLTRARSLLRSVLAEDPGFAPAHAYLAEASVRSAMHGSLPEDLHEARRAAGRALELDPGSAVAHRVLAMVALNFDWDFPAAEKRLRTALELEPTDPINHLAYATYLSVVGQHDRAIAAIRTAVDLDPDSMVIRSDAGFFLLRAGRLDEAALECEMVLRVDPANRYAPDCLLTAYSQAGDAEAARAQALRLMELAAADGVDVDLVASAPDPTRAFLSWRLEELLENPDRSALSIATHYLKLGDEERGLDWLERAAQKRSPLLIFVPEHAAYRDARRNPRFERVIARMGLSAPTTPDALALAPARNSGSAATATVQEAPGS